MITLADLAYGPHDRNLLNLYLPDRLSHGVPLVVCIHGGGWTSGDKEMLAWAAAKLVEGGLAAATVNHRFCPQWPFPAAVDDVQRAVRWLRHQAGKHGLDGSRFAAIGNSSGGHLASFLGLTETRQHVADELGAYSSRVSCVVDCYGPVDLLWIVRSASAPIVETFLAKELSARTTADYLEASPMALVAPPVCPFLILHGTLDVGDVRGEVPIGISERFANRLQACGGEATFLPLEGAGHGFMHDPESPHAQRAIALALEFFQKHLGPRPQ